MGMRNHKPRHCKIVKFKKENKKVLLSYCTYIQEYWCLEAVLLSIQ